MLAQFGAYTIAFAVLLLMEIPFLSLSVLAASLLKKYKKVFAWVTLGLDAAKITVAMWLSVWLIGKIGSVPVWCMFVLPGYWLVHRGLVRASQARAGTSRVRQVFVASGRAADYDQAHDVRVELMHLKGDLLGWLVGAVLFLRSAPIL